MMKKAKSRVLVAMSGGVDSSLTAALLLEKGYEVIGATMQLWPKNLPLPENESGCCSLTAVEDARRVADFLSIPHYVLNMQNAFEQQVIQPFINEYLRGRTPNPCIRCNEHIKFNLLLQKAAALDCDFLATGHYARIMYDEQSETWQLWRAKDHAKDQSYFLYRLNQHQMSKILFPLGEWTKPMVREKARKIGLEVSSKTDSQEICFIQNNDYRDFLRKQAPDAIQPGNIIDKEGKVLKKHEGIAFYTIGQRKGLGVHCEKPVYVIDIRPEDRTIVVGDAEDTFSGGLYANELAWPGCHFQDKLENVDVKIRYGTKPVKADIRKENGYIQVSFHEKQRAVTPGQSAVFYSGERVLGGGIITKSLP